MSKRRVKGSRRKKKGQQIRDEGNDIVIAGRAQIEIRKGEVVMAYDHGAFRVRNVEDAVRFYCDKLGFELLFYSGSEEYGEKGAFLAYHGARLELIETIGASYEPVRPERPYCPHLCFETDDMERVILTLKENGIEPLDGPNEIPGSERWLYFTDPDWNVLEYIQWLDQEKCNEN